MIRSRTTVSSLAAVCAGLAMIAAGCNRSGPSTVIVKDNGPAEFQEAVRLAEEGERARKAGKSDRAIQLFQESLSHSEDLYLVWNNLGLLLLERGDRMQAVTMFNRAADIDPLRAEPYFNAGLVYMDNAQPERALEYFRKSLARQPRYLDALRGVARVGRILALADEEALEWMKSAMLLEKDPAWRRIFEEEKYRIDGALKSEGRAGKF